MNSIEELVSYGISVETFNYRYKQKGMTVEDALRTPKMVQGRPRKKGNCL